MRSPTRWRRSNRSRSSRSYAMHAIHESQIGTYGVADTASIMKKRVVSVPVLDTGAPYSLCACYGDMIYVAGLPPFDAAFSRELREARASGWPPPAFPNLSFERQVEIVMDNLKKVMEAAGSHMDCPLKGLGLL